MCVTADTNPASALRIESVPLTDEAERWAFLELLSRTRPSTPLTWLRNGEGFIGAGRVLRLAFRGASRFSDAARAWKMISGAATIDDQVGLPGSGLVAFGTFAFSDASGAESVLLIPEFVFGQRDGVAWVSRFVDATALAEAVDLEGDVSVTFESGIMSEAMFMRAVVNATQRIAAGDLEKVVIARDLSARLAHDTDLRLVVSHLAHLYADCFTFAVDGMIGATPETLIQVTEGAVSGRILAGTTSRNDASVVDAQEKDALLASGKDLAEHRFAVESVAQTLEPFTRELSIAKEPFALELPNVWHLASDFSGTLSPEASIIEVVGALHPTAAVAGTPRADAQQIIAELEPFDRGRYAGPVGWLDANGNGEWGIALRCAQVSGEQVTAFAGAGIVAGSDPDQELAETWLKFRPILSAFGADD